MQDFEFLNREIAKTYTNWHYGAFPLLLVQLKNDNLQTNSTNNLLQFKKSMSKITHVS